SYPDDGLLHVDEPAKRIYFTAVAKEPARHPYYAHLYAANYDGTGLTLLTPEDAHHEVRFSPNGKYIVDSYSRIEAAPVTVLRSAVDGHVVRTLEKADITRMVAAVCTTDNP